MSAGSIVKLAVSIGVCLGAGALGSVFTALSVESWYRAIDKPAFTPPSWVFGPVWTLLYILMGIALFLVWRQGTDTPGVRTALTVFVIQLALNTLWSLLFFGLRRPLLGLIDIALLWAAILVTMVRFHPLSRTAAWLLAPYLAWVSYATALNFAIWRLNR